MMNAAPPFCPVVNGNLHILPSPTAEPAVASTRPILEPKFPLLFIILHSSFFTLKLLLSD